MPHLHQYWLYSYMYSVTTDINLCGFHSHLLVGWSSPSSSFLKKGLRNCILGDHLHRLNCVPPRFIFLNPNLSFSECNCTWRFLKRRINKNEAIFSIGLNPAWLNFYEGIMRKDTPESCVSSGTTEEEAARVAICKPGAGRPQRKPTWQHLGFRLRASRTEKIHFYCSSLWCFAMVTLAN